jgi:alpha-L-rhamnosidase
VATRSEAQKALQTVMADHDAIHPGAPYLYHYFIEALVQSGLQQQAKEAILSYWGDMVRKGADTFWEVYDPSNEFLSPYDFYPVNSYCHAWSCTPVYFIRKYPEIFQK